MAIQLGAQMSGDLGNHLLFHPFHRAVVADVKFFLVNVT